MKQTYSREFMIICRLYQYFRLSCSFLYVALLARWLVLLPLVTTKFLPGGIHKFLCSILVYSSIGEIIWSMNFNGLKWFISVGFLKNINFLYFVSMIHFWQNYEYELILKNTSYSFFIIGLSFTQSYSHWNKLFKKNKLRQRKSVLSKLNAFIMNPLLYFSEFYMLLLNVPNIKNQTFPILNLCNKLILIAFIPILLHIFKKSL